jgi:hypothetical protein
MVREVKASFIEAVATFKEIYPLSNVINMLYEQVF